MKKQPDDLGGSMTESAAFLGYDFGGVDRTKIMIFHRGFMAAVFVIRAATVRERTMESWLAHIKTLGNKVLRSQSFRDHLFVFNL